MEERKLPTGRIGRFARLLAMGARSGPGMLLGGDGASNAERAAEVLGTLRGIAAKVGQMASYVDGLVPDAQKDAFETSLKRLRADTPRSSPAAIRAVIEAELGAPIEQLFASFSDEPIASASIGQVHRAVLPDGLEVAVKVQHPGIHEAVESDLANAGVLESFASALGGHRFAVRAMVETIRARFREELDYGLEAERLAAFARIHAGDPSIRIPRGVPTHSARRVLTTELVRGLSFEEACASSEDERRAWAETLWRFVFKGNLAGGMFNADPHPGNYLFQEGGRIAFLDFGCVQTINDDYRTAARAVHDAALEDDGPRFAREVSRMITARPGRLEVEVQQYLRLCFEPLFASPYRVTRSYAASLVGSMKALALVARKTPKDEFFTMPAEMLFINRLQFGFYSLLARLDVEVDYAAIERTFLRASTSK